MITVRPSHTLAVLRNNLLESVRSFSNNSYYDARYLGINDLQVINDDSQKKFGNIPNHPHANTEILSYQIAGATRHIDSMGNDVVDTPGNVYRMSCGTGIYHSEQNVHDGESRYIQIWFKPNVKNTTPTFSSHVFTPEEKMNNLVLVAGPDGPLTIKTDSKLYAGIFTSDWDIDLHPSKTYYIYVLNGSITANGHPLQKRDAIKLESETELTLSAAMNCEVLFFEL